MAVNIDAEDEQWLTVFISMYKKNGCFSFHSCLQYFCLYRHSSELLIMARSLSKVPITMTNVDIGHTSTSRLCVETFFSVFQVKRQVNLCHALTLSKALNGRSIDITAGLTCHLSMATGERALGRPSRH